MVIKRALFLFTAVYAVVFVSFGRQPGRKLHEGKALLIEAYTQRILPGRRESRGRTETHFIIAWQDKQYPQSFMWLNGGDTIKCSIIKAHKISADDKRGPAGNPGYYSENTAPDKIQNGDTLDISACNAGKAVQPAGQPKHLKSALLYIISDSKKMFRLQVDSTVNKGAIAMP